MRYLTKNSCETDISPINIYEVAFVEFDIECSQELTVVRATKNNASCPMFSVSGELFMIIRILLRGNDVSFVLEAAFFFESISSAVSADSFSLITGMNKVSSVSVQYKFSPVFLWILFLVIFVVL